MARPNPPLRTHDEHVAMAADHLWGHFSNLNDPSQKPVIELQCTTSLCSGRTATLLLKWHAAAPPRGIRPC